MFVGVLRQSLFGISEHEATFAKRGFQGKDLASQQHLESAAQTFVYGYNAALRDDRFEILIPHLHDCEVEKQGFAFEGAAMGIALVDYFSPWRQRFQAYSAGPGDRHIYMVYVGMGWTFARLPGQYKRVFPRLDPLLRWLAVDGYGFHEGYFSWPRTLQQQRVPSQLSGYALRAFDQGVGRSLWFVHGADAPAISATIATFPMNRQADLWSGIGLASAYAGGNQESLTLLQHSAEHYLPHMLQGVAFAAQARQRAGNPSAHTDLACKVLCGLSTEDVAALTREALQDLHPQQELPAYEIWRQRIQAYFVSAVTQI